MSSCANMRPSPIPSLTLIVAATHCSFGIGRASTLPWPPLKSEMVYFARVTRRAPFNSINAVIMGRKTWESIPQKFRPLAGRLNVVVSRTMVKSAAESGDVRKEEGPFVVGSIEEGVEVLRKRYPPRETAPPTSFAPSLHRIFVIGGAEIYKAVLQLQICETILLTRVYADFECDTFFPIQLGGKENDVASRGIEWINRSKAELDTWVGEDVPAGKQQEKGVEWEFEMWQRKKDGIRASRRNEDQIS